MRRIERARRCFDPRTFPISSRAVGGVPAVFWQASLRHIQRVDHRPDRRADAAHGMWDARRLRYERRVASQPGTSVFATTCWNPDQLGLTILRLIVGWLLPVDAPIVLAVDDTLFRRSGRKVHAACWAYAGVTLGRQGAAETLPKQHLHHRRGHRRAAVPRPTHCATGVGAVVAPRRSNQDRAGPRVDQPDRRRPSRPARSRGRRPGIHLQGTSPPTRQRHPYRAAAPARHPLGSPPRTGRPETHSLQKGPAPAAAATASTPPSGSPPSPVWRSR